ncbi:MAG: dTDP-4-dehydrorhamnose reductase [Anaerolineales bacterium]|nr:dTDP-4-dehydrorhamnose reductase [Anaerolineales bacterium]
MNKVLLFGKRGQLGWELERALAPLGEVHAFSSSELDLGKLQALKHRIQEIKPDIIINAAAYTAVDRAEQEVEQAMRVNAEAPAVMAEAAKKIQAVFIHYSTDYVFDGAKGAAYAEEDATNPLNVYGQSKLKGEQAIGQVGGAYLILRTSWVYSLRGDGFVSKVLKWARNQNTLQIVSDQIGSPTWARALATVTQQALEQTRANLFEYFYTNHGTYHLGGEGSVSRFDFAKEILRLTTTGKLGIELKPALTSDFPTPAIRPLRTDLDCSKFAQVFNLRLPNWHEALKRALSSEISPLSN